jgi:hypothetical protein
METMKIMKAIKSLLIVLGLASVLSLRAQTFAEPPTVQMHSTSAMMGSGSELPQAAVTGTYTTYSSGSGSSFSPRGPQRSLENGDEEDKPDGWDEPFDEPLGDMPWVLMVLLVLGYALRVGKKYGLRMLGAGK